MVNRFTITLPGETQDNPEDVRTLTFTIGPDNGGAGTEIDLPLFAGQTFHPAKRYGPLLSQAFDKSANTVVTALKSMLIPEVLVDSLAG